MKRAAHAAGLLLGLLLSSAAAADGGLWLRYALPGAEVKSLVADPATPLGWFLGTAQGGIYRSTDGGRSWAPSADAFPGYAVTALAPDPIRPATLWAGLTGVVKGGLLVRSDDRGASFQVVRRWEERAMARAVALAAVRGRRVVAVGGDWGAEITEDDGESWRPSQPPLDPGSGLSFLSFPPSQEGVLWAGSFRHPFRSTDLGRTWSRLANGMIEDTEVFALDFAPRGREMWAATCGWVYRSTDAGASWVRHKDGMTDRRTHVVRMDPRNPARILAGTTGGLFESLDAGATFHRLGRERVVNALAFDPRNPAELLIGTESEGVLRSEDGGATTLEANRGLAEARVSAVALTASGLLVVARAADGESGGLFRLDPETGASERLASSPPATVVALQAVGEALVAATPQGVFRAERPGEPFALVLARPARGLALADALLVATDAGVFASEDGGRRFGRRGALASRVDGVRGAVTGDGARTAAIDAGGRTLYWSGAEWVPELYRRDGGTRVLGGGFGRPAATTSARAVATGVSLDPAKGLLLYRADDRPREALAVTLPEPGLAVSGWAGDPRGRGGLYLATIGRGLFRFVPKTDAEVEGYRSGMSR